MPSWSELIHVALLRDYNTRVVVIGVCLLGVAAGVCGAWMLLRKRSLLGDALSHAALPGIGLAFLAAGAGASAKSLPLLLTGAALSGVLGVLMILLIVNRTRVKEDAALGIVLSVFFGAGVAVLGVIQRLGSGHAAGLKSFIYGKTASMLLSDAMLTALCAACVGLICLLLYKEFAILCFDAAYARAQGWPVLTLDIALMAIVVAVTVVGLQAVGLILMIAMLIIPAAAARFWTDDLSRLLLAAALIGGVSGYFGAAISALTPRMPAGAIIVLVAGGLFVISMLLAPARGVLARLLQHWRLNARIARQHVLRAMYELGERTGAARPAFARGQHTPLAPSDLSTLLKQRSWSRASLLRDLRRLRRAGLVTQQAPELFVLTPAGAEAARLAARNHRLWELYLITHADIAPNHVDRDADTVEHVLDPAMIAELEQELAGDHPDLATPPSPHPIAPRVLGAER